MKKVTALLLLPLLFTGCRLGCEAEKVIASRLAQGIATVGNCTHVDAIQVDVLAAIDVVKLCAAKQLSDERCKDLDLKQGPLANVVCPLAVSALVSVVGTTVPVRYGCKLAGSPLSTLALQACEALPF